MPTMPTLKQVFVREPLVLTEREWWLAQAMLWTIAMTATTLVTIVLFFVVFTLSLSWASPLVPLFGIVATFATPVVGLVLAGVLSTRLVRGEPDQEPAAS